MTTCDKRIVADGSVVGCDCAVEGNNSITGLHRQRSAQRRRGRILGSDPLGRTMVRKAYAPDQDCAGTT